MYDVIIGHYEEDKNIPFGGQKLSYRVETLHTGWRPLALQNIFRFWKFLKILDFVIIFLKKVIFWNFGGQKSKIWKIRDSRFVDLAFLCIIHFVFVFDSKTIFLVNFQTFTFYRPKIAWSDVTKFDLYQKISGRFWFSLHETTLKWCPERCAKFHVDTVINEEVIPEKPRGGRIRPPRRWRVKGNI